MTDSDVVELVLMDKNEEEEATALAENDYVTEVAVQPFQLQSSRPWKLWKGCIGSSRNMVVTSLLPTKGRFCQLFS